MTRTRLPTRRQIPLKEGEYSLEVLDFVIRDEHLKDAMHSTVYRGLSDNGYVRLKVESQRLECYIKNVCRDIYTIVVTGPLVTVRDTIEDPVLIKEFASVVEQARTYVRALDPIRVEPRVPEIKVYER